MVIEYYPVLISWLHLISAIIWIGGSIFISFILTPAASILDHAAVFRLKMSISRRFTPIAIGSVVLIALSGFLRANSLTNDSVLIGSTYGKF